MSDVLARDIAAINAQYLNLIARNAGKKEEIALRLNCSITFCEAVSELTLTEIQKVSDMGICLMQPLIDAKTITNAAVLTIEQGRAHLRSAAKLKLGL